MPVNYVIRAFGSTLVTVTIPPLNTVPIVVPNQLVPYFYAGSSVVPIGPPQFYYQVNGSVLPTQPYILTAPTTMAGNTLQAGSLFVLAFNQPDTTTQALLADGSQCSMTFGLPAGDMLTGTVSLASSLTGSTLQVVCTLMSPITINHYVIQTPFW